MAPEIDPIDGPIHIYVLEALTGLSGFKKREHEMVLVIEENLEKTK